MEATEKIWTKESLKNAFDEWHCSNNENVKVVHNNDEYLIEDILKLMKIRPIATMKIIAFGDWFISKKIS